MNIQGKIKVVNNTVVVSEKFQKRTFVVVTNETYPNEFEIQLAQDKCGLIDGFKEGDGVDVSVNLRGRSWVSPQGETKYFLTAEGWKIVSCDTVLESAMKPDITDEIDF